MNTRKICERCGTKVIRRYYSWYDQCPSCKLLKNYAKNYASERLINRRCQRSGAEVLRVTEENEYLCGSCGTVKLSDTVAAEFMSKNEISKVENKRLHDIDHIINKILAIYGSHAFLYVYIEKNRKAYQKGPNYIAVVHQPSVYALIPFIGIDAIRENLSKIGVTIDGIEAPDMKQYPEIKAKSVLELFLIDSADDTRRRAA